MEPFSIVGGVSAILQITSSVTKLAKKLTEVRESYNNVALNITLVESQLTLIRAALQALHKWRASDTVETEASKQLDKDLELSLSCCRLLISVIDGKLAESGYQPELGVKQKINYMWLENILKDYVSNLESQVRALDLLLTIFQCQTATEQRQQLAKAESRSIIEQVRAETMSLSVADMETDADVMSILSRDPSVHLDVDSILMRSPAYVRVYGERESPRRKQVLKPPPPPPPPPPRRKLVTKPSPPLQDKTELALSPSSVKPLHQPPPDVTSQTPPLPVASASQAPSVPPRPKARNPPRQSQARLSNQMQKPSQGRINVWDYLGPGHESDIRNAAPMSMADSAQVFELPAPSEPTNLDKGLENGQSAQAKAATTATAKQEVEEQRPEMLESRPPPKIDNTSPPHQAINTASSKPMLAESDQGTTIRSQQSDTVKEDQYNNGIPVSPNDSSWRGEDQSTVDVESRSLSLRESAGKKDETRLDVGECLDESLDSSTPQQGNRGMYIKLDHQKLSETENGLRVQQRSHSSVERPTSLEGFRNELDLAFEKKEPQDASKPRNLHSNLPLAGSDHDKTTVKADVELAQIDANRTLGDTQQVSLEALSIRSSVDLYDASVRNLVIEETSRRTSHSSGRHEENDIASPVPVIDSQEAEREDLSTLNQQQAAKYESISSIEENSTPVSTIRRDSQIPAQNLEELAAKSLEDQTSILSSSYGLVSNPQIVMTPSIDATFNPVIEPPPSPVKTIETPASPSRAPPLPPISAMPTSSIPVSSPPVIDQGHKVSGFETSTSSSGRASSVFEASSTISSSEQSLENTTSTLSKSTSNTAATSVGIDASSNARQQAQADLRRLQNELANAKSRNDSKAFQDSIQKSIEVISRTYLAASTPLEKQKSSSLRARTPFRRLSNLTGSSNGSVICEAAAAGDLEKVRALLDTRVNVDARGKAFGTPLMLAAINGHIECLNLLRKHGADEFAVDTKGRTVMHLAVASKRVSVVEWLLNTYPPARPQQLKHKPSILSKATDSIMTRSPKNLRETSDAEGSKPLHIATEVDSIDVLKALLAAGVDVESKNNWGRTPLHHAIISNRHGCFTALLQSNASVHTADAKSMTPLHWAAKTGNPEMIKVLLAKGAGGDYDNSGNLPIHQAAWAGKIACIEALIIERKDLEIPTKAGETMLHIACLTKNSELTTYLLENGVDVNPWAAPQPTLLEALEKFKVPLTSLTPLHYACCQGDLERALVLLEHEAWANAATPEGVTALMMAAESEDTNTVNLLLSRGAKPNASMPGSLMTALHIASRHGDLETVQQLCRAGANRNARTHGGSGNYGRTPAEEATTKCNDKVKKTAVEEYFRTIRQNQLRNSAVRPVGEQGQPYEMVGRAYRTSPSLDIRATQQPVSYAPWAQSAIVPMQQAQYGYQQQMSATYPPFAIPMQQQVPQQWYDPQMSTYVESPPPYQAGSSTIPGRLAAQAPVYRPGDASGP